MSRREMIVLSLIIIAFVIVVIQIETWMDLIHIIVAMKFGYYFQTFINRQANKEKRKNDHVMV